jgi:protocatechuate 3,4-dioxygenase beta subunit
MTALLFVGLLTGILAAAQPAPGTGVITGRVVEEGTNAPLADATVRLMTMIRPEPGQPMPEPRQASTDREGRYRFEGLAPGRYSIAVQKTGYASPTFPGPPQFVILEAGKPSTESVTALQRGAVITGRVLGANGQPLAEARVTAMRRGPGALQGRLMMAGPSVTTNDLGEFRIHSLAAGEYFVQATPGFSGMPRAPASSLVTVATYYPGTTDTAAAQGVRVAAGGMLNGVEIGLLQVPAFAVAGVVVDQAGEPVANAQVMINSDPAAGMPTFIPPGRNRTNADGSFRIEGLPAGTYLVRAAAPIVTKSGGPGSSVRSGFSSAGPGGGIGYMVETDRGVTTEYRFDQSKQLQIRIEAEDVTGVQLIADRPQ